MGVEPEFESTGNAELDKRLAQPVLRGDVGIETAQVWISAFLIFIVGLIGWSSSLRAPFQGLDQLVVRDNAAFHSLVTLPEAGAVDGSPQPLAMLTLALNWAVAPGTPVLMRATSLLLHLINGLLVFFVCRRLLPKAAPVVAMTAGMLFVLHPLVSESILYVVGRGPILATTFALGSVLLYIRAVTGETGVGLGSLAGSVACFVFAVLADASAAVVPLVLLAVHWALGERARAPWRVHAAYWAALVALAVYAVVDGGFRGPGNVPGLFAEYARLAFFPSGLSIIHDAPRMHLAAGLVAMAVAGMVMVLLLWGKTVGGVALAWLVAGLVYAAWAGPAVIERRAYFALAGLALVLPWLYELVKPKLRPAAGIVSASVILVAGVSSYMRTTYWQNEYDLWQDTAVKAPLAAEPQANLGKILAAQALQSESALLAASAETVLKNAIACDPSLVNSRLWLASALQLQGKNDEALQALYDVLRIDLSNRNATLAAANLLFDSWAKIPESTKPLVEAIELYGKADKIAPLGISSLERLAAGLQRLGQVKAAEGVQKRVLSLESGARRK